MTFMIMRVRAPLWRSTFWNLRDVKDGSNSVLKITIDTRRRNKSRCELNHERISNQNIDMQVPAFNKKFTYDIYFLSHSIKFKLCNGIFIYWYSVKKKNRLKIEDHFVPKSNKAKENPCLTFKKINSKLIPKFLPFIMVSDPIIRKHKCSRLKLKPCRYRLKETVSTLVFRKQTDIREGKYYNSNVNF